MSHSAQADPTEPESLAVVDAEGSGDRDAIYVVIRRFFSAFVSGPKAADGAALLRDLLLPGAVVVRTCGDDPQVLGVEDFIRPRVELLSSGAVRDFREWPASGRIDRFGDMAQVWCRYEKSWVEGDAAAEGRGMKSVQLVRTSGGWRISAIAWDDERPGVPMPRDFARIESFREDGS